MENNKQAHKIGRPKSAPGSLRDQRLTVYLTETERDEITSAADALGIPTATLARNILTQETRT
jgi:hypothetical protein